MKPLARALLVLVIASASLHAEADEPHYVLVYQGLAGPAYLYKDGKLVPMKTPLPKGTPVRIMVANINPWKYVLNSTQTPVQAEKPANFDALKAALTVEVKADNIKGTSEAAKGNAADAISEVSTKAADEEKAAASRVDKALNAENNAKLEVDQLLSSQGFIENPEGNPKEKERARKALNDAQAERLRRQRVASLLRQEAQVNRRIQEIFGDLLELARDLDKKETEFTAALDKENAAYMVAADAVKEPKERLSQLAKAINLLAALDKALTDDVNTLDNPDPQPYDAALLVSLAKSEPTSEILAHPWQSAGAFEMRRRLIERTRARIAAALKEVKLESGKTYTTASDLTGALLAAFEEGGDAQAALDKALKAYRESRTPIRKRLGERTDYLNAFQLAIKPLRDKAERLRQDELAKLRRLASEKATIGDEDFNRLVIQISATLDSLDLLIDGKVDAEVAAAQAEALDKAMGETKANAKTPLPEDVIKAVQRRIGVPKKYDSTKNGEGGPQTKPKGGEKAAPAAGGIAGEQNRITGALGQTKDLLKKLDDNAVEDAKLDTAITQFKALSEKKEDTRKSTDHAADLAGEIEAKHLELPGGENIGESTGESKVVDSDETKLGVIINERGGDQKVVDKALTLNVEDRGSFRPIISAGFVYDRIVDRSYRIDTTSAVPGFTGVIRETTGDNQASITTAAFAHLPLTRRDLFGLEGVQPALSLGVGINVGTGSSIHYYPGLSLIVGRKHGFVLTGGIALGNARKLVGARVGDLTNVPDSANLSTENRFVNSWFVAVGIRF